MAQKLATTIFHENVHVAHDCQIEDGIVMCNNVALAGYGYVMQGSILGLNSSVHQFQTIGSWSMIGMNCCVAKPNKIEPGYIYIGVPARKLNRNKIGLSRNKVTKEMLVAETHRYKN